MAKWIVAGRVLRLRRTCDGKHATRNREDTPLRG